MLLHYKNLVAEIKYISRVSCFYGEVTYNNGTIIFLAEQTKDLAAAFKTAVDQYLIYEKQLKAVALDLPEEVLT